MRTWTLMLAAALPLALGTACADDTDDTDTDTDSDTDSDSDSDSDTSARELSLSGTVTDASGNAVEGADMFLCNYQICFQVQTDADGGYEYIRGSASEGSFALKIKSTGRPTATTPLVIGDSGERSLDITLPDFDNSMSVPRASTEVELGDGLFVTMSGSDLTIPPTSQSEVVGGTLVGTADLMPIEEAPNGTLAGIYYVEAYDAVPNSPLPARFDATALGLSDGDSVDIYVHSYKKYTEDENATTQWVSAGSATVQAGGFTTQLPYLATVAVYAQ